jgi:uncharacterized cupredoxin-like copper-binding protein
MKTQIFRKHLAALIMTVLLFSVCSCGSDSIVGQLFDQMGDLFKIKQTIDQTLVQGETSIHIQNGKVITLGLVNTKFNDVDASEREKAANEVVDVLLNQIDGKQEFKNVSKVIVNFIHHEKKFLVVNYTMTVDYYVYNL